MLSSVSDRGNETIYLQRGGPLLENGLDRQRTAMVDMALLASTAYPCLPVGLDGSRLSL